MIDLRFPTALQIMLFLAVADSNDAAGPSPTRGMTSAQLARGMGVQPSFIRRFLAPLAASGLIIATQGKAGGVRLARPSKQIGLHEIYRATIGDKKIWQARSGGPQSCLVSSHTKPFFEHLANDAERAVLEVLGKRTLAESVRELESLDAVAIHSSAAPN